MSNEEIRARFNTYYEREPVDYLKIGATIGLDTKQRRYLLSRFAKGKNLNINTLTAISEFLKVRGY